MGLIVAMGKELDQLLSVAENVEEKSAGGAVFHTCSIAGSGVVAMRSGIGKVNAAVGATRLISLFSPGLVVSTGVAAGADTSLSVGDVVAGTSYAYHDAYCGRECAYGQIQGMPERFAAPAGVLEKAASITSAKVRLGPIVSGDWFVDTVEKMRSIAAHFPDAAAVDMESCAIAHACHLAATPFVSFRIISDVPLSDTGASQYFDFWDRLADGSFRATREFVGML